jgi:hypothetical protein
MDGNDTGLCPKVDLDNSGTDSDSITISLDWVVQYRVYSI